MPLRRAVGVERQRLLRDPVVGVGVTVGIGAAHAWQRLSASLIRNASTTMTQRVSGVVKVVLKTVLRLPPVTV